MKRLLRLIIKLIPATAFFLTITVAGAEVNEQHIGQMETHLLALINDARANPLAAAAGVGLNPAQVSTQFPALACFLDQGMPLLESDEALVVTARAHTQDMLTYNFYGYDDPTGVPLMERMRLNGYYPEMVGERLGLVGFFNFIDPARAVHQIFDVLLKKEFDPDRTSPLTILNPEFEDIGIAFQSGILTLNGVAYNVYLVTCYFGRPLAFDESERQIMARQLAGLINQFRAKPMAVIQALNLDISHVPAKAPWLNAYLSVPLPPLLSMAPLDLVAGALAGEAYIAAVDETATEPVDEVTDNPTEDPAISLSLGDRLLAAGYPPTYCGQTSGLASFHVFRDSAEAVYDFFKDLVLREFDRLLNFGTFILLNDKVVDIGIGISEGTTELNGEPTPTVLASVVVGATQPSGVNYILGAVYEDANSDGLNSPGEGLADIRITFEKESDLYAGIAPNESSTDDIGTFVLPVTPGTYLVTLHLPDEIPASYWVRSEGHNVFLDHPLVVPTP